MPLYIVPVLLAGAYIPAPQERPLAAYDGTATYVLYGDLEGGVPHVFLAKT